MFKDIANQIMIHRERRHVTKLTKAVVEKAFPRRIYGKGFIVFLDHNRHTVKVEYSRICDEVFESASAVVEKFINKGYDNI